MKLDVERSWERKNPLDDVKNTRHYLAVWTFKLDKNDNMYLVSWWEAWSFLWMDTPVHTIGSWDKWKFWQKPITVPQNVHDEAVRRFKAAKDMR